jgi:hypothetical protein
MSSVHIVVRPDALNIRLATAPADDDIPSAGRKFMRDRRRLREDITRESGEKGGERVVDG